MHVVPNSNSKSGIEQRMLIAALARNEVVGLSLMEKEIMSGSNIALTGAPGQIWPRHDDYYFDAWKKYAPDQRWLPGGRTIDIDDAYFSRFDSVIQKCKVKRG